MTEKKARQNKKTPKTARRKTPASGKTKKPSSPSRSARRRGILVRFLVVAAVAFLGWMIYLDAIIRAQFEGKKWAIPATVYARPLEIYVGAALNPDLLAFELDALGYRQVKGTVSVGEYRRTGGRFLVAMRAFQFVDEALPERTVALSIENDVVQSLETGEGGPLGSTRLEPLRIGGIYPQHKEERVLVRLDEVPDLLVDTLLTIEDKHFYTHHGVSPLAIARALWVNATSGRVAQGGSTLTQQLVKNFFLSSERTLWRKIEEALMALLLDWHYDKREILETYLNEIYLGQSGELSVHGFGLASQFYFGKHPDRLTPDEIALLVAMVKGPSYYNPRRNIERATQRRNLVLSEMARAGLLAPEKADAYMKQPIRVIERPQFTANLFPAFMELVRRQLNQAYRPEDLNSEGLRIFTTLDPQVQHQAELAIRKTVARLDRDAVHPLQVAMVMTGTESGEVKALIGGRDPRFAGYNRALDAVRPIGSLVKPAVYLTALSRPEQYTLNTVIPDQPISVSLDRNTVWTPENFDKRAHGNVTLHHALAHSLNLSTAALGLRLGVDQVIATLHQLGVTRTLPNFPSVLLGSVSLSPLEVASMYQTISAGGFATPVRSIRAVMTPDHQILSRYDIEVSQRIDARVMHLLHFALREVMEEGTGRAALARLPKGLHVAGKTGTTNDQRDSWFAGFSGDYLGVVWMGRDDNGPTARTGSTGALRVWTETFRTLPQHPFTPVKPEGVSYHWVVDGQSLLTDEGCQGAVYLPFLDESVPTRKQSCLSGIGRVKKWIQTWFD